MASLRFRAALAIPAIVLFTAPLRAQTHAGQFRLPADYAQSIGAPYKTIIVFGDQYNGGDELYDAQITIAEVVRGEKARQRVKSASSLNPPAAAGLEYLIARVRFQFSARTKPEHYSYVLDAAQFSAMSADGKSYDAAALAEPLKPVLHATLRDGDSAEGWVAFLVPRSDHTPLMSFHEDVGNLSHEGIGSIFKLYYEKPAASGKTKPS